MDEEVTQIDTKKLKVWLLKLDSFYRRNRDKLAHPVRAKHFLYDFRYFTNIIEDTPRTRRFGKGTIEFIKKNVFTLKKENQNER